MIHPTAIVEDGANVAPDVIVGPYAIIEHGATVGGGCEIGPGAIIRSGSVLAERVRVDSYTVVGGDPQDLSFDRSLQSGVHIGTGTIIREHATLHRSTHAGEFTEIGAGCLIMATAHVGHDSTVGDGAILANAVLLGGHAWVGQRAFVGGSAAMHQHCRVGESSMIGGLSRITRDAPPFCMVAERDHLAGLNLVGLRRRGFEREWIKELKDCFHAVFDARGGRRDLAVARLSQGVVHAPARIFLEFFQQGKRGFAEPGAGEEL